MGVGMMGVQQKNSRPVSWPGVPVVAGQGFEPWTSGLRACQADLWVWLTFGDPEVDGWVEAAATCGPDEQQIQHQVSATSVAGVHRRLVDVVSGGRPSPSNG